MKNLFQIQSDQMKRIYFILIISFTNKAFPKSMVSLTLILILILKGLNNVLKDIATEKRLCVVAIPMLLYVYIKKTTSAVYCNASGVFQRG